MHKKQQNNYLILIGLAVAVVIYTGISFGGPIAGNDLQNGKFLISLLILSSLPLPFFMWWFYQRFNKKILLLLAYLSSAIAIASLLYIFTQ